MTSNLQSANLSYDCPLCHAKGSVHEDGTACCGAKLLDAHGTHFGHCAECHDGTSLILQCAECHGLFDFFELDKMVTPSPRSQDAN